jgi:hypothetical protein
MFVFGISLPVVEILFVLLVLFIVALAVIIVQLVKMGKHIRVLDETTLEIRRYEEEEEVTLKPLTASVEEMTAPERRDFTRQFVPAVSGLCRAAAAKLLAGRSPESVKRARMARGIVEQVATRAVNNAVLALNRYAVMSSPVAREEAKRLRAAARAK